MCTVDGKKGINLWLIGKKRAKHHKLSWIFLLSKWLQSECENLWSFDPNKNNRFLFLFEWNQWQIFSMYAKRLPKSKPRFVSYRAVYSSFEILRGKTATLQKNYSLNHEEKTKWNTKEKKWRKWCLIKVNVGHFQHITYAISCRTKWCDGTVKCCCHLMCVSFLEKCTWRMDAREQEIAQWHMNSAPIPYFVLDFKFNESNLTFFWQIPNVNMIEMGFLNIQNERGEARGSERVLMLTHSLDTITMLKVCDINAVNKQMERERKRK